MPFNPEKEKQEWLDALEPLYSFATGYLDTYVQAGQISISYQDITLNEEQVGSYHASEMHITIGTKTITT